MAKKSRFSEAEHLELGPKIHQARNESVKFVVRIGKQFPKASFVHRRAKAVRKAMNRLCSELDNEYYLLGARGNSPYYQDEDKP